MVVDATAGDELYRRVTRHLLPPLLIAYVIAYLDRVNVGFAKLQMLDALHFSESVYGIGAGVFFVGYFLFGVPANLILNRVGARRWLAGIMLAWGIVSACMALVRTAHGFYAMRLLLGIAEAGFFPGVIHYLGQWYPPQRRAAVLAAFMSGIPICGALGGPLSGWIMEGVPHWQGLAGWQWLFVLEALPALLVGAWFLLRLEESPHGARWLSMAERQQLALGFPAGGQGAMAATPRREPPPWAALAIPRVWLLCGLYFCAVVGLYGIGFWLPTILAEHHAGGPARIGLLTGVPYALATAGMIWTGRSAERLGEHRWHVAVPAALGAASLVASGVFTGSLGLTLALLSVATWGLLTAPPMIWNIPVGYPDRGSAAAGIALINSCGNLAGFVSPFVVGTLKQRTGSTQLGLAAVAAVVFAAAALVLTCVRGRALASGEQRACDETEGVNG